ncbi:MAG TPA: ATP-binding protein [Acetobacteraceae bacterium]|nr:ATP-binding protein [Acetobacteraceae bacterium]
MLAAINVTTALLFTLGFASSAPVSALAAWLAYMMLSQAARLLCWYCLRTWPATWGASFWLIGTSAMAGLGWGATGVLFDGVGSLAQQMLVPFFLAGMAGGSVVSLSAHLPAFFAFIIPALLPYAAHLAQSSGAPAHTMALATFAYAAGLSLVACQVHRSLRRLIELHLENSFLVAELSQALGQLHAQMREREQAEEQLRHAQKMEAVGQLTGGIAHDFNNMLQGISGSLELARRRMEQGRATEAAHNMESAHRTLDRAATLTQRLLAFARREALQPRPVQPDALIESMAELIQRTVGPEITVALRMGEGIWTVLCDPNQLENVLLNLAINARDAMPEGGQLTISTKDVCLREADVAGEEGARPGEYVEITVSDSGTGMTPDVLARAFEPFFTTKPLGQGTGLGLSQLYGFIRQSYGVVRLDSAPGRGTTARLYLPRHRKAGGAEEAGSETAANTSTGAGRTLLLVEDETDVREVIAEVLRERGYQVLEAGDGPAALHILQRTRGSRVDALVTDVGLPGGLNGRQVADAARECRPGLPVLFITGYAGTALKECLAPGMAVIGKPFTLDTLAAKIWSMLEAASVT